MKKRIAAPELYTDRLKLVDMTEKDACFVVECRSDPDVYKYFVSPHKITIDEHLKWFRERYIYDENRFDWIAFSKEDEPIGAFGVKRDIENMDTAEVSYILSHDHYGKGYASEAVNRLIIFCKDNWNCSKVIAEINKDNNASIKFVEKLGFVAENNDGSFIRYVREI